MGYARLRVGITTLIDNLGQMIRHLLAIAYHLRHYLMQTTYNSGLFLYQIHRLASYYLIIIPLK